MREGRDFYVYEHVRPDTGAVFYVGKGRGRRAWNMTTRSRWHRHVTAKLATQNLVPEVRLVAEGLSNGEAIEIERERIAGWRLVYPLVNFTDGGEGGCSGPNGSARAKERWADPEFKARVAAKMVGRRHSEATKAKLAQAARGKTPSAETRAKLAETSSRPSNIARLKELHAQRRGYKHTEESREKMTRKLLAAWSKPGAEERRNAVRERRSKAVVCLNTGVVYSSADVAAKATGASRPGICEVCKGRRLKTKGLQFAYA